ncbi:glutamate binding protein [Moniliophthora roreri]|nr:glutamate binding protein [Moniliophthora roreri]
MDYTRVSLIVVFSRISILDKDDTKISNRSGQDVSCAIRPTFTLSSEPKSFLGSRYSGTPRLSQKQA